MAGTQRVEAIDFLRGLAVILVIFQHAFAVPAVYHGVAIPSAVEWSTAFFAPFRMPLLFFLSGLFLLRSLEKGAGQYFWGKARNIAWPFVIWTVIFLVGGGKPSGDWTVWTWASLGHTWFLFTLGACYILGFVTRWIPSWALALFCFALAIYAPVSANVVDRFFLNATYFFAGAALLKLIPRIKKIIWPIGVILLAVSITYSLLSVQGVFNPGRVLSMPMNLLGAIALLWLAFRLPWGAWSAPFLSVGRSSIVYYLVHMSFQIWIATALVSLGAESPWIIGTVCFAGALAVAYVLDRLNNKVPWKWLFAAPTPKQLPSRTPKVTASTS